MKKITGDVHCINCSIPTVPYGTVGLLSDYIIQELDAHRLTPASERVCDLEMTDEVFRCNKCGTLVAYRRQTQQVYSLRPAQTSNKGEQISTTELIALRMAW